MPIYIGSNEIKDIKIGNVEINEVYIGTNKVWERATTLVVTNDTYYEQMNFSYGAWHKYDYNGFASGTIYYSNNQGDLADSSISPNTFTDSTHSGGAPVVTALHHIRFRTSNNVDQTTIKFTVDKPVTNDGWTTMTIGNTSYNRANATTFTSNSTHSTWQWVSSTNHNPFGATVSASVEVKFT